MRVLVTGSSGLVGSETVSFFDGQGADVVGIDNNMRADFFGPGGDTTPTLDRLKSSCRHFTHLDLDIRDRSGIDEHFKSQSFDLIIHTAAQPSHDLAAKRPLDDFDVNAVGTLNLLEATRRWCPDAVFIFTSTNKVYGDGPNRIELKELETRWEFADSQYEKGIAEDFPIDHCLHSVFGASKVAADVMTQEYGRYYGLRTGVFRGGCLTGPQHAGVELHGFLQYLVSVAVQEKPYTIFGYKGKQVRDQIHSADVVSAFWHFFQEPRPGEVYNLGGGKANAASVLECIKLIEAATGKRPRITYADENRIGDHICYYSDMSKFMSHYPTWKRTFSLEQIVDEIVQHVRSGPAN